MNVFCLNCKKEIDNTSRGYYSILSCRCGEIVGDYKRFRSGNIQVSLKLVRSDLHKKVYSYGVSLKYKFIVCFGDDFMVPSYMDEKQAASELLTFISSSSNIDLYYKHATVEEVISGAEVNPDDGDFPFHFVNEFLYDDFKETIY